MSTSWIFVLPVAQTDSGHLTFSAARSLKTLIGCGRLMMCFN